MKRVLVSDKATTGSEQMGSLAVAILFEASPGFRPSSVASCPTSLGMQVAILFEASPGFRPAPAMVRPGVQPGSQSSLKRVLVSDRFWRPHVPVPWYVSQSSLKRVLVSDKSPRGDFGTETFRSQSSLKRVLVSDPGGQEGVIISGRMVAILFEASPGFRPS